MSLILCDNRVFILSGKSGSWSPWSARFNYGRFFFGYVVDHGMP
ncbi:hypothetical protein GPROT1_03368 [Gammaproteobacteria bacterium]|nr:hypothetical protein GPROT1_03368 [Gammaproteobacteria bacterium]